MPCVVPDGGLAKFAAGVNAQASRASIERWQERLDPCRMAAGKERHNLVGVDQVLLAICLHACPDAQSDEIAMFVFESGGEVHTRSAVSKRMKKLKLTQGAVAWAVCSACHATLQSTPGQLVFEPDMIWDAAHVADWQCVKQRKQTLTNKNNKKDLSKSIATTLSVIQS